jgi:hypothetical protein
LLIIADFLSLSAVTAYSVYSPNPAWAGATLGGEQGPYLPLRYYSAMRYLIQFPVGTGDLIPDAFSPYVRNFKVHYRDDSAMIFDSPATEGKVAGIPFAKNSFVVIASTPRGR